MDSEAPGSKQDLLSRWNHKGKGPGRAAGLSHGNDRQDKRKHAGNSCLKKAGLLGIQKLLVYSSVYRQSVPGTTIAYVVRCLPDLTKAAVTSQINTLQLYPLFMSM